MHLTESRNRDSVIRGRSSELRFGPKLIPCEISVEFEAMPRGWDFLSRRSKL